MNTFNSTPFFGAEGYARLDQFFQDSTPSKVFFLVDSNTSECLPRVVSQLPHLNADYEVLEVDPGEGSKELEIAASLWQTLLEYGADRHSLLINVGGGMVCDLGAFIASTFKRGITFVHVPTSLLAMVDASVGGKNGVNFGGLKNQIGTFHLPNLVIIDEQHLTSLPESEWRSGHGEMIKHSLISGSDWPFILSAQPGQTDLASIERSVNIKLRVVKDDPHEKGLRKILNFGHTLGHAWESFCQASGQPVPHGMAVIQGLHLALMLSGQPHLQAELARIYPWHPISEEQADALWQLQLGDKKNEGGTVKFVLLQSLGNPQIDQPVDKELWLQRIQALNQRQHG